MAQLPNSIHEKLVAIQSSLKAPKLQTNAFGKYKYRSCEDILEAVKPLLKEHGLTLTIWDDIEEVGGRVYVKATATISETVMNDNNELNSIQCWAFARESQDKKGMDDAQITGAASSYARKYALNGLFLIDDTKDADATNDHKETPKKKATKEEIAEIRSLCTTLDKDYGKCLVHYTNGDWTEEAAKKAIKELTEAKNNLNKELTEKSINT